MSMPLYMSEADIILHVCVELMLNRCTPVTRVLDSYAIEYPMSSMDSPEYITCIIVLNIQCTTSIREYIHVLRSG